MKKMRFFLCVVLSAAAFWSCGGDGDGEPGPEPPVPPVVDPNAVEVVNSGFEKGLEGWTRVDFHNGGKVTVGFNRGKVQLKFPGSEAQGPKKQEALPA